MMMKNAVSIVRLVFTLAVLGLLGWRCVWLVSAVPNTTAWADAVRQQAAQQCSVVADHPEKLRISFAAWEHDPAAFRGGFRRSFSLHEAGVDVWDAGLPVWITPGSDGEPGWATWDDNGNGTVDDDGELGAAWSDDFCVVALPGETEPLGRILDSGAFVTLAEGQSDNSDATDLIRHRYSLTERSD